MNAFIVWSQMQRRKLSTSGIHHAEVSKLLGKQWKLMNEEQKKPYFEEATRLQELHSKEFPDYKYKPKKKQVSKKTQLRHLSPNSKKIKSKKTTPLKRRVSNSLQCSSFRGEIGEEVDQCVSFINSHDEVAPLIKLEPPVVLEQPERMKSSPLLDSRDILESSDSSKESAPCLRCYLPESPQSDMNDMDLEGESVFMHRTSSMIEMIPCNVNGGPPSPLMMTPAATPSPCSTPEMFSPHFTANFHSYNFKSDEPCGQVNQSVILNQDSNKQQATFPKVCLNASTGESYFIYPVSEGDVSLQPNVFNLESASVTETNSNNQIPSVPPVVLNNFNSSVSCSIKSCQTLSDPNECNDNLKFLIKDEPPACVNDLTMQLEDVKPLCVNEDQMILEESSQIREMDTDIRKGLSNTFDDLDHLIQDVILSSTPYDFTNKSGVFDINCVTDVSSEMPSESNMHTSYQVPPYRSSNPLWSQYSNGPVWQRDPVMTSAALL